MTAEPRTAVQTLAAELDLARQLLREERRRSSNLERQLIYQRERHEYFKRLTVGYEVELRIRPGERAA